MSICRSVGFDLDLDVVVDLAAAPPRSPCWYECGPELRSRARAARDERPISCLKCRYGSIALNRDHDFLVPAGIAFAGRNELGLHPFVFGVAQIHARQIACKNRRFVAAGAAANLDEDVLIVVGVAGDHQLLQIALELLAAHAQRFGLVFGKLAHLAVALARQRFVLFDIALRAFRARRNAATGGSSCERSLTIAV